MQEDAKSDTEEDNLCEGRLDIVDLGYDYFLARFETKEDLDQVAVWVRFPGLPIEFYNIEVLKKIGSSIGLVLRIESHTASNVRGRYARLSVQVNLDKPLITTILVGKFMQQVLYEGIHTLCFACGRLGHKRETCEFVVKGPQQPSNSTHIDSCQTQPDTNAKTPVKPTDPPTVEYDTFGP
ncbi:hypothetical protein SO802_031546 [Lithocarpus litseifolius]|uniref:CCHC-type domain-containing protein n=1 Tax=Lithocarpus litseifolius TaxID=425828 RepID=A0AAW2BRD2_9ROSI